MRPSLYLTFAIFSSVCHHIASQTILKNESHHKNSMRSLSDLHFTWLFTSRELIAITFIAQISDSQTFFGSLQVHKRLSCCSVYSCNKQTCSDCFTWRGPTLKITKIFEMHIKTWKFLIHYNPFIVNEPVQQKLFTLSGF
jgi:hypothetical protein